MRHKRYSIPMLNAARLHEPTAAALRAAFDEVLASGRFIGGEKVEQFESRLAKMLNVSRAVGTSSGTDALLVAMIALGVRPGDEVITTPYTFFATAGSIARLGATPVFADIDPTSFNIDPTAIASAITSRTVGMLPVHLFGQCADMNPILKLAESSGLWVLEDAAQSIGATLCGRFAGTMGTAGILSFFPAKNLGALGDAGAVLTNDNALADKIAALRNHGAMEKYRHETIGGNFRLDALQAAFLSVKLPYLASWQNARRRIAARYRKALSTVEEIALPAAETHDFAHVYNQFVIRAKQRDDLKFALESHGIETAVYYPQPLHLQPCFKYLDYKLGDFPNAEHAAMESLALPMDPLLPDDEQRSIVDVIDAFFGETADIGCLV